MFEEAFNVVSKCVPYAGISRILDTLSGTLRAWKKKDRSVDFIAIFNIFQWVSNVFHVKSPPLSCHIYIMVLTHGENGIWAYFHHIIDSVW